jgi:hypothetical protein
MLTVFSTSPMDSVRRRVTWSLMKIMDPKWSKVVFVVEFYTKSNRNIRSNDLILITIDSDMRSMIKELMNALKDPYQIDEEDF